MSVIDSDSTRTELPGAASFAAVAPARGAITWRSLLIGTLAAVAVCALTPYNDFVLSDTSLTAGYLPLSAVLIEFLLVVAINAPLHRWAPRAALGAGELAIIVLMTLLACSVTNWGLARFFVPTPVAPFHVGAQDTTYWDAFVKLGLPKSLFPVSNVADGRNEDIARWFFTSVPDGERVPLRAWTRAWTTPLLTWGVFMAAMLATLVAVARLVVEQWMTNERLPFPLVQVQAALIEPPAPGKALNALFRSRALWWGLAGVFAIHMLTALNAYFPKQVPKVPLGFDFTQMFGDPPLSYLNAKVKKALLSFTIIGATYFIRSRASFSLWATFLIVNLVSMQQQMMQRELASAAWADQHLGACIAFILGIAWIGRHHWARVLKSAVGLASNRSHAISFWIAVLGTATMVGWLWFVGVHLWFACVIVFFILMAHLVVSRILAETGLPWFRASASVPQFYTNCPPSWFTGRDIFMAGTFSVLGPLTTRDGVMGFAMHGFGICKQDDLVPPRQQRRLGSIATWALLVSVVVAIVATLYCQYSYPTPMADTVVPARNYFGAEYIPKRDVGNAFTEFSRDAVRTGRFAAKPHSPLTQVSLGFGITTLLEIGSLRWASWPFLPVGYVASYGAFIGNAWFSIFVGWLAKVLIVRFGGSKLYQQARPFFVGIIFGESLAAGAWLILNAIVVLSGGETQAVKFLL